MNWQNKFFISLYNFKRAMQPWYSINNINTIDSPALIVYPDRVKENIRLLVKMAGDASLLRPHVKTHKMAEVSRLLLEAGITKFKCATIAEAEMLALVGAPNVLIAHQPAGPKIERLLQLTTAFPNTCFSCMIDNPETAAAVAGHFLKAGKKIQAFIDLNTGMNRSGILPEKALQLFNDCQALDGLVVVGLHAYDGHIRDTSLEERNKKSDAAFAEVDWLLKKLAELTDTKFQVVVGGSPSFPTHTRRKNVQYSPGTFVFWDWGYKHLVPDEPFDYAALVITRIISVIDKETVCTDLGHKAVAAENPLPRVHFLNAPDAIPVAQSEEHLVVKVPAGNTYKVGDVWYGVPVHICPTVALYQEAAVVENHQVTAYWNVIARNRRITL